MLCSIIIPLYNKADYIEEALRSVLAQTYQQFEIIVVDDGSKDDGVTRVQAVNDKRVTLIQQSNGGVSKARNRGIELAKGDLVCFLDADDWYQPQYLETIVAMAKQHPELAFFATYYRFVNTGRGDEKFWQIDVANNTIEIVDDLFYRWRFRILFNIDSFAVRRDQLLPLQTWFPVGEQMGEDQDLYFRLAEKSAFAYCPLPLTSYRVQVGDSLCATYQGGALFPAYQRLEQRALKNLMPKRLQRSALRLVAEARVTTARETLSNGSRWHAILQLSRIHRGVASRRWWVTLIMCTVATPDVMRRWEKWRRRGLGNAK